MRNPNYYSNITKTFQRPAFEELMQIRDDDGHLIRETSDVEYILGMTYNDNATAMEVVRQYLVGNSIVSSSLDVSKLSNEQIMNMLPPRSINTLTDAYQYSKFLEQNSKYIEKKAKEYSEFLNSQNDKS